MSQENENNEELDFDVVLEEFREAVYNGQVRLALEKLLTIVDVFVDVLSSDPEEDKKTEAKESKEVKTVIVEEKQNVEPPTKKTATKQSEVKVED